MIWCTRPHRSSSPPFRRRRCIPSAWHRPPLIPRRSVEITSSVAWRIIMVSFLFCCVCFCNSQSLDVTQCSTNCLSCKPHYHFTLLYFRIKPIFAPAPTFFTNSDLPNVNLEKLIIIAHSSSISHQSLYFQNDLTLINYAIHIQHCSNHRRVLQSPPEAPQKQNT